jgi:hypothetical protein
MTMKISNIPHSVYLRALELRRKPFEPASNNPCWTPEDEYEYLTKTSGWSEGELEIAIYEHMCNDGWSTESHK